jgi:hypothetical protein
VSVQLSPGRLGALAGVGFVVLNLVGGFVHGSEPSLSASAAAITAYYRHHHGAVITSLLMDAISSLLLLLVAIVLADLLRGSGRRSSRSARKNQPSSDQSSRRPPRAQPNALGGRCMLSVALTAVDPSCEVNHDAQAWAAPPAVIGPTWANIATHLPSASRATAPSPLAPRAARTSTTER